MADLITVSAPVTLGNIVGPASDGVLHGAFTATALAKGLLKTHAQPCLCISDDGGTYVNETTEANEATADDVEIVGTTIATGDALYVGHATLQGTGIEFEISTQGDYTTTTFTHKYWNGTAWATHTTIVDGTTAFEAATGAATITYDAPADWEKCLIDGVLGYWTQIECDATGGSVTPCQIQQIWWIVASADATWTDDTTDLNDAGAGDVATLPARQVVGDGFYFVGTDKYCKLKATVGTAAAGTHTIAFKYWNGTSYAALTVDDDSAGWSTGTSTYFVHFSPPSDWVANTAGNGPNGEAGWTIVAELTALTSVTTVGLLTQAWVYPLVTGASGMTTVQGGVITAVDMMAHTASGSTADSKFLLVNVTTGAFIDFTWTKADAHDYVSSLSLTVTAGDELLLVQYIEDGTTEFANAQFTFSLTAA